VICLTGAFAGMLVGIQEGDIKFKLKFIDLQQLSGSCFALDKPGILNILLSLKFKCNRIADCTSSA